MRRKNYLPSNLSEAETPEPTQTPFSLLSNLPTELLFSVLEWLPKSDLRENARLVSSTWYQLSSEILSKSIQTLIKTPKDLEKFLRRRTDGRLINPFKLSHLAIDFLPDEQTLNVLKELTPPLTTITVAAPTKWNQEQDKIEATKSLLKNYPNLKLRFHYRAYYTADPYKKFSKNESHKLYNWTEKELKQLWDSLGNPLNIDPTPSQSQILRSLADYEHEVSVGDLEFQDPDDDPFFTNISIIDSTIGEDTKYVSSEEQYQEDFLPQIQDIIKFINSRCFLTTFSLKGWPLYCLHPQDLRLLVKSLKRHPNLTRLNLSNTGLGAREEDARILSKLLFSSNRLVSLNLSGTEFTSVGISILGQALIQAKSVKHLKLNYITEESDRLLEIVALMPRNNATVKLRLSNNPIIDQIFLPSTLTNLSIDANIKVESLQILLKGLSTASNLRKLNFNNGGYDDTIGTEIAALLKVNRTITSLKARHNKFSQETAKMLADVLTSNTRLKKLDLSSNPLGSKGIRFLAKALTKNRTLRSLMIPTTIEEDKDTAQLKAVQALSHSLTHNGTLKHLDFSYNFLSDSHIAIFLTSLTINHTLTSLIVGPFEENIPIMDILKLVLETNRSLEFLELLSDFNPRAEDVEEWIETFEQALAKNMTLRCLAVRLLEDMNNQVFNDVGRRFIKIQRGKPHLKIIITGQESERFGFFLD